MAKQKQQRLGEDKLRECNTLLQACADTGEYLQQCRSCGINVDEEIRENDGQREQLTRIKRTFFPGSK